MSIIARNDDRAREAVLGYLLGGESSRIITLAPEAENQSPKFGYILA